MPPYSNHELKTIFQSPFKKETWMSLLRNLFNNAKRKQLLIDWESFDTSQPDVSGYHIGSIDTTDNYSIGLFYFDIKRGSVERKKVGLRNLVKSFINPRWGIFDAAFAVFNSGGSWRLSLISDIRGEQTEPKRYTYVFGKSELSYRTPISRFTKVQENGPSFSNLLEAFSVEALSDEFFDKYRELYADFVEYITGLRYEKIGADWQEVEKHKPNEIFARIFKENNKSVRDYIKKLMGRITFLHFLQRKGWMNGDLNYMRNLFQRSDQKSNYLEAVLEPLFFGVLNTRPVDRKSIFLNEGWNLDLLSEWKDVPYLNGGLFERDDADIPNIVFPDIYFSRLFRFFSEYNFTIDENDPNDAEVGVDPEMLGKIFENLLEDNKDKGAFYTPKEVVQYMCQESLIAYLEEATHISKTKIRNFVSNPEENKDAIMSSKDVVLRALKRVKICDPAIGSGAFPMGLLNELVRCREALSDNLTTREQLKKSIINNNIYGVDIEKGAVDIARLRFWLSIVVDDYSMNPDPLPNLDYKIMRGNSLIESFHGVDLSSVSYKNKKNKWVELWDTQYVALQKSILMLLDEYYSCSDHEQKHLLQGKISRLVGKELELMGIPPSVLTELNGLDIANNELFFLWHTWFSEVYSQKDPGFDIVIGNPPYISTKGVYDNKEMYESEFGFSDDAYNMFFFKGISLLNSKGTLCYITPKTYWTIQTKRNLRDLLLSKQIRYIFDAGNPFKDVLVDACITSVSNKNYREDCAMQFFDGKEKFTAPSIYSVKQSVYLETQNCAIFLPNQKNLELQQIFGDKVRELYDEWWNKIKTSRDIEKNREELKAYQSSLRPGDIALLGCLTDGGQGLATANNGKYLAVRNESKWADKIRATRPEKLAIAILKYKLKIAGISQSVNKKQLIKDCELFLLNLSEQEIASLFDNLKELHGRDIFGQGYIYKIAEKSQIASVDLLSEDEKENGIDSRKPYYVPYDKGDKDGNRWYVESPYVIAWTKENVRFLKTDRRARYQGQQFYFKEGFCWNNTLNPNARLLKVRIKRASVNDVGGMSLSTLGFSSLYLIAYLNSNLIFDYYRGFINCTVNVQINDLRQIPVIIPNDEELDEVETLVKKAILLRKQNQDLSEIETKLDRAIARICIRSR